MFRGAVRIVVVAVVAGLLLVPGSARACACGAAYAPEGHTVEAGEEIAFLSWAEEGERERLEMLLGITTDTPDLAVLVPTPTVPAVTQGDPERFDELARLATPPAKEDWSLFGEDGAGAPPGKAPEVISRTVLEDVVATVIEGGDASGVAGWLRTNGYATKPELEPVIADYLDDGWRFTAVKMRGDKPFDGYADPIVLTFDTPSLVYPMRLSSAAEKPGEVTVFTLDRTFRSPRASWVTATEPAAAVELVEDGVHDDVLDNLVEQGQNRLTRWTFSIDDPATLTSDLELAREPGIGETFTPAATESARDAERNLSPWVAVVSGTLGLVVGAGAVLLLRRRRSSAVD
ncbi:DUF2330 domain-containing protein [Nocardioides albus]|uniref:DUF2330 domain-containing protein n=1 Tax=Nocardioides albus TaxID=1841 RepID=A0A7W5A673_9ACTN|nr:DUF2330 domain-containing protein [Nocardioides albus]MBB3090155.1 hypothetical protein [Nocardioides albus]GGU28079.1 hypothetical protein GCM10007979_28630 [Nocardioides albus]